MTGLPKEARLLNKADYDAVFSKSVKVSDSTFLVLIHKTSRSQSRLGLIISKKVDKRAVQRNRIKRISRESFRSMKFSASYDCVVLARPHISKLSNKEIFQSIDSLWERVETKVQRIRKKS